MPSRPAFGLLATATLGLLVSACARDLDPLAPATFPAEPGIFDDNFGAGVGFAAFGGSKADAVQLDQAIRYTGESSLRITVPLPTDPSGSYAGGAFTSNVPRDLTGFNALTFWGRASRSATLNVAGLGNDNTGTSRFTADAANLPLTATWTKFVIPIPDPSKLDREAGLFYFAEGAEDGQGYTIWFDQVQYEKVAGLSAPRPAIGTQVVNAAIGGTARVTGGQASFTIDGRVVTVTAAPEYFSYMSSDESVATVNAAGLVTVVGEGEATITAMLGATTASGSLTVRTAAPPETPAPTPTRPAGTVVSMFSDAYTNVTIDTWSAEWDAADVEDIQIGGNAVKKYSNLSFAGIEAGSAPIDASAMTHFHLDFYTPDGTDPPAVFKIKLVDFGPNGVFDGGDDAEHEVTLTSSSTPAITTNAWASLDIPLSAFAGLTTRGAIAQMIISGDPNTVYLDNIYFYSDGPAPTEPPTAAPTPTLPQANVVSLFSDAYTDVTVDRWSTDWDVTDLEDVLIQGNATKKYSNLVFLGIEATSAPIDASAMTHFHIDLWTPSETADPKIFKIKLVDFGADGGFQGGDDTEHEIILSATSSPGLATGTWLSLDIPLSDFVNLTGRGHIAQLIMAGDLPTVFVDNVYFHN